MEQSAFIIAIDGPAASGKGTLARRIAVEFGLDYLDTGKLYRLVAWKMMQDGQDIETNTESAGSYAKTITPQDLSNSPHLYGEKIGRYASIISAIPEVREALLDFQRNFAYSSKGAVLDGRDIGTVICPDANIKLFVTADLEARANRRFHELHEKDPAITYEKVLDNLKRRDSRDSKRTIAPLTKAADAIYMDTTHMSADEAFSTAVNFIHPLFSRHFGLEL